MLQFVVCVMMLLPIVALPAFVFLSSPVLGVLVSLISIVLAIPLVFSAIAHFDLHRAKSRYGLRDDELDEFSRLVPRLASRPEYASLPPRELRRSAKLAAARTIRERRGAA